MYITIKIAKLIFSKITRMVFDGIKFANQFIDYFIADEFKQAKLMTSYTRNFESYQFLCGKREFFFPSGTCVPCCNKNCYKILEKF